MKVLTDNAITVSKLNVFCPNLRNTVRVPYLRTNPILLIPQQEKPILLIIYQDAFLTIDSR